VAATLEQGWVPDPNNPEKYMHPERPGWLRDRVGQWYADPNVPSWYRDDKGRIVWLAPHEPSATERQAQLRPHDEEAIGRIRRAAREVLGDG
jgi:hypothetical protein